MHDFMRIDLSDFDNRREAIAFDLIKAASQDGFFYVVNHNIPLNETHNMFDASNNFFDLPDEKKQNYQMDFPRNAGWEKRSQVRPSTGDADLKESIQLSFHNAPDLRPSEADVPGFDTAANNFMQHCNHVSQQLLTCFAIGLGFPVDFFTRCHDITQPDCLNSLRCTRYLEQTQKETSASKSSQPTDIYTFSLLFQQPGQEGLEVFHNNSWIPVIPQEGDIVCHIGDMIVRWSDDQLQSKHVRSSTCNSSNKGPRYALEYINEANRSTIIQGRTKYTKPITAGEYIMMAAMERHRTTMKSLRSTSQPALLIV
ncbi:Clavaminate synthase-like protein [Backusella circina FSU 941]|nr:Clavaminate synthase-like protein [Backusella circina FSU 941]